MASGAMKIQGSGGSKKKKPTISHTLPASFYKNYVPPATPKINPQTAKMDLPEFDALPKTSPNKQTFAPSSLKDSKLQYPMSMPAHRGLQMGPKSDFGFSTQVAGPEIIEEKESDNEPNSLVEETKKLKVGSFTCFQVMSGPIKSTEPLPDNKDAASATSQQTSSTFASADQEAQEVASDNEDEEEDLPFDME